MSEEWLFVYLDFCLAVYSSRKLHLHRPWFPKAWPPPLPSHNLFTLCLPRVSPRKSADHSTWLILNGSCKEMCLFINTNPVPPVYCSHGSNHLLNKQLLCLPVWVVCLYPIQGLGKKLGKRLCASCGAGMWGIAMEILVAGCVALYCHSSLEICFAYLGLGWSGWQDYMAVWSDCKVSFGRMYSLPLVLLSGNVVRAASGSRLSLFDWGGSGLHWALLCR